MKSRNLAMEWEHADPRATRWGAVVVAVVAALIWSYWTTIVGLVRDWQRDPNYSVGQLVPFAALYMLWLDRRTLVKEPLTPCGWGVLVVAAAQVLRAFGLYFVFESAERYALVVTIIGLVLLLTGPRLVHRMGWILAFLFLMVPLPGRVHNWISGPLQGLATSGGVFFLELAGIGVAREGNVVVLNDRVPIAVAEACSGLRMLTAFVVVGCVMAYGVSRPRFQKALLVLSTIPIAIVCNLIRLVATALLFLGVNGDIAERFFHDFAGWTMMPIAVLMLAGELWLLGRLEVCEDSRRGCEN